MPPTSQQQSQQSQQSQVDQKAAQAVEQTVDLREQVLNQLSREELQRELKERETENSTNGKISQASPAEAQTRTPEQQRDFEKNVERLVSEIFESMDGLGTDEDKLLNALTDLKRDPELADAVIDSFENRHGDLSEWIRGDFSFLKPWNSQSEFLNLLESIPRSTTPTRAASDLASVVKQKDPEEAIGRIVNSVKKDDLDQLIELYKEKTGKHPWNDVKQFLSGEALTSAAVKLKGAEYPKMQDAADIYNALAAGNYQRVNQILSRPKPEELLEIIKAYNEVLKPSGEEDLATRLNSRTELAQANEAIEAAARHMEMEPLKKQNEELLAQITKLQQEVAVLKGEKPTADAAAKEPPPASADTGPASNQPVEKPEVTPSALKPEVTPRPDPAKTVTDAFSSIAKHFDKWTANQDMENMLKGYAKNFMNGLNGEEKAAVIAAANKWIANALAASNDPKKEEKCAFIKDLLKEEDAVVNGATPTSIYV